MKFTVVNETSHLFAVIVIKGIPYDFIIYIFLDFGLTISFTTRTTISIIIVKIGLKAPISLQWFSAVAVM